MLFLTSFGGKGGRMVDIYDDFLSLLLLKFFLLVCVMSMDQIVSFLFVL